MPRLATCTQASLLRLFFFGLTTALLLLVIVLVGGTTPDRVAAQSAFSCANVTEISQSECRALAALYNSTNGPAWSIKTGWLVTNTPCTWYGVTCDGGHVTLLMLPDNGLSGPLPPELGALIYLRVLDLAENPPPTSAQRAASPDPQIQSAIEQTALAGKIVVEGAMDYARQRLEEAAMISATLIMAGDGASPVQAANVPTLPPPQRTLTETSTQLRSQLESLAFGLESLDAVAGNAAAPTLEDSQIQNLKSKIQSATAEGVNQLTGALPPSLGNLRNLFWLDLSGNQLSGSIPAEIGLLTNLTNLDLQNNQLSGALPVELSKLTNLTHLTLYHNTLTGAIPPALGLLTNLQLLDLGANQLTGAIPPDLGNLTNLTALGLCGNGLSGSIPPQLGNLTNATIFFLCYNQLSGPIPAELGGLTSMQNLRLDVNQLSGPIPVTLGNLQNLQFLRLETNQLSGSIPASLGGLPKLLVLDLSSNALTGPIPPELGKLQSLVILFLSHNALTGPIPPELGKLSSLTILGLYDNRLSGPLPPELGNLTNLTTLGAMLNRLSGPIPPALGQLRNLQTLFLNTNELSGVILPALGDLRQLQLLDLSENQLTGSIPATLTNLTSLTRLYLYNNQLSGSLPTGLDNWVNLDQLILYNNYLSGALPPAVGNLPKLTHLLLDGNRFSGAIPAELGRLTQLIMLRLGPNHFTGTIPPALGEIAQLQELWLNDNQLSGEIPPTLGALSNLYWLWLHNNQLSGELPATLGNLTSLKSLYLHNNHLRGPIPPQLGDLPQLESLWLSNNLLSGAIPPALGRLDRLQVLHLDVNRLSGPIPPELGDLSNLAVLGLAVNQLSGPIPPELGRLTNLQQLVLAVNQLSGPIPPEVGALTALRLLLLRANLLSGALPPELGKLRTLRTLWLDTNQLSGPLPPALGQLTNLTELRLYANQLTGSLPTEWQTLTNLERLQLDGNRLSGPLPREVGYLGNLWELDLSHNDFNGTLPPELRFLTALARLDLRFNGFTAENGELLAFLAQKAPDWAATQTTAPTNLQALPQRSDAIALSWTPIAYGDDGGAYEVEIADAEAGPFTLHGRTIDKRTPGYTAEGLAPNTTYYFRVRTVMPPHGDQRNTLTSPYTGVVSATTTTAATAGDSYESDDRCADVRALVTDGRTVNHTFHQPGDQDWVQFTTQVSVTYRIDVQPTAGSPADVVLKLYDSCADSEPVTLDQSFSPGVQFTFVAPQSGVVYLQLTNADNTVSGSDVAYQLAVRAVDGESGSGAVILVAGRLFSSDDLQANIEFVIQRLYQTLLDNGYQADDIYYLSNDSSNAGVDAPATVADLRYAITTWAKNRITDAYGLTLYLMDHGDQGLFYIDDSKGERLTPAQLDDWLTELETVAPNAPINLFIEACYSGSFISGSPQSISKPGRVVITSTNLHNLAFASAEGAYFSDHLLTALRQGHHLFSGFWEARIATRQVTSLQQDPWLDADGDGVPNELEDAAIAARRTLFAPTILATSTLWPPYIATIQETTGSDGQRRVQADVRDNGAITRVWAVIYPPGYVPPASGNELAPETLDNVNLTLEGNRYVLPAASFTQPGNYRVVIHAEDADGLRARPAVITINPTGPLGGGNLSGNNVVYLPLVNHQ